MQLSLPSHLHRCWSSFTFNYIESIDSIAASSFRLPFSSHALMSIIHDAYGIWVFVLPKLNLNQNCLCCSIYFLYYECLFRFLPQLKLSVPVKAAFDCPCSFLHFRVYFTHFSFTSLSLILPFVNSHKFSLSLFLACNLQLVNRNHNNNTPNDPNVSEE